MKERRMREEKRGREREREREKKRGIITHIVRARMRTGADK